MDGIEIRPLGDGEQDAFLRASEATFLSRPDTAELERERDALEPGRALVAAEDGRIVATATSMATELTRPGGTTVAMAAVTAVGALPTHRRRGLASALLTTQLQQCRELGDVACGLLSSEAPIYGRYGYGVATERHAVELDAGAFELTPAAAALADGHDLELAPLDDDRRDVLAVAEPFWERHRRSTPGEMSRTAGMWAKRQGARPAPRFDVTCRRDGEVVGVAMYGATTDWAPASPVGTLNAMVVALDAGARLALLRFLCEVDLVATVKLHLAVDDDLPWALVDRRAVRVAARHDWLWLRVLDVVGCLDGRATRGTGTVVIEVVDDTRSLDPPTSGRWMLHGDGQILGVEPLSGIESSTAEAVTVPIAALGSLALGGVRAETLAAAGAAEGPPAAVARLGDLLGWPSAPLTLTSF